MRVERRHQAPTCSQTPPRGRRRDRPHDCRIAPHLGGRAFGDLAAEVQHMNLVGDIHDDPHVVLDHQHGDAEFVADIEDEAGDVLGLLLVHAGHHFVEQQQLRLAGQRAASSTRFCWP